MKDTDIANYALIGNARAAALVSVYGSIDWCCLPEFDSGAIFAALLDQRTGGRFAIHPANAYQSTQRYVPDTNVVQTLFTTAGGKASLTDAFTAMTETEKASGLHPDHEILRMVEGISGTVSLRMEFTPRIYYGKSPARLHDHRRLGLHFSWKGHLCTLVTTLLPEELVCVDSQSAESQFEVKAGEKIFFSLSYSNQAPAIVPELHKTAWNRMANTITYWRDWIGKCGYRGLYGAHVRRSALALKLLTHAPSGAIVAAPTTSLPENPGGERNWDYRYCWLRDASFTTRVLLKLGFEEEVHAYMNWILHATQLTRPKLQVVYSVYGHTKLDEQILQWLAGYKDSSPVRIGNTADDQFQLDVYGEVLDAVYAYSALIDRFDRDSRKFIVGLGQVICKVWQQPDNGIWGIRSPRKHHTHSKVMCWVGLDRLIKICTKYQWLEAPVEEFRKTAATIRHEIERSAYNDSIGAYVSAPGSNQLDASALAFSLVGYTRFDSERMKSTVQAICRRLLDHNMVRRYNALDDGLNGREGAFALCNFWLVENLARSGSLAQARKIFETTLACMGPSGLLSEEIDPATGCLLGNYPQAFTHIGLVNAAFAINEEHARQEWKGKNIVLER